MSPKTVALLGLLVLMQAPFIIQTYFPGKILHLLLYAPTLVIILITLSSNCFYSCCSSARLWTCWQRVHKTSVILVNISVCWTMSLIEVFLIFVVVVVSLFFLLGWTHLYWLHLSPVYFWLTGWHLSSSSKFPVTCCLLPCGSTANSNTTFFILNLIIIIPQISVCFVSWVSHLSEWHSLW